MTKIKKHEHKWIAYEAVNYSGYECKICGILKGHKLFDFDDW